MAAKKQRRGIAGVAAFLNSARKERLEKEGQRFKRQKIESPVSSDSEGPEEDSIHAPVGGNEAENDSSGSEDDSSGSEDGSSGSNDDSDDSNDSNDSGDSNDSHDSSSSSSSSPSIYQTSLPPALPEDSEQNQEPINEHPCSVSTPHTPYWPDYSALPKSLSHYYHQRRFLFSKFDQGVLLNNAQWFSTTPELVAEQVAQHLWSRFPDPDLVVVDAFGGAGGNAIQLAHYYNHVICIDIEPESITCAKQNAWVYGVSEKIEFVVGDCLEVLSRSEIAQKTDIIFGSPPWGGPSYKSHGGLFNLYKMEPLELRTIHKAFSQITENVCYFLPKNSCLKQIQEVCGDIETLVDVNAGKNPFPTLWPVQQKWAKTVKREDLGLEVELKQTQVGDDVNEEDLGKKNEGTTLTYNYINGRLKGCMVYLGGLA